MPVIVLVAICLITALLLACINLITSPEVERRQQEAIKEALGVVLPEGENFEELELTDKYPDEINSAYKADGGFVFELTVKGKEFMTVMVGVNSKGEIVRIEVISESETPGYKDKVFPLVTGENGKYNGMTSSTLAPEIVSNATYSSNAVYDAARLALDGYTVANGGEISKEEKPEEEEKLPRSDEEIKALAAELLGVSADELSDVTPEDTVNVKRVYRDEKKDNYAVYTVIMSQYGYAETETLLHITERGELKAVNKLQWNTSPAMWGYVPPSAEEVNAFYDRLPGNTSHTIGGVDLVTNATNTSTGLVGAINEAFDIVNDLEPAAEIIGIVIIVLAVVAFALAPVAPKIIVKFTNRRKNG